MPDALAACSMGQENKIDEALVATQLQQAFKTAHSAISLEAFLSLQTLAVKETNAIGVAQKKEAEKKKRELEREAKLAAEGKPVNKKANKKDKKKKAEKKVGLALGVGTTQFRQYLHDVCSFAPIKTAAEFEAACSGVSTAIDPSVSLTVSERL